MSRVGTRGGGCGGGAELGGGVVKREEGPNRQVDEGERASVCGLV